MTALPMTDQQRERYIRECGVLMVAAMVAGNRQEAESWMQAEMHAIGQRSAAQVARMTAEVERAIDDGVNYFAACGARHGARLRPGAGQ